MCGPAGVTERPVDADLPLAGETGAGETEDGRASLHSDVLQALRRDAAHGWPADRPLQQTPESPPVTRDMERDHGRQRDAEPDARRPFDGPSVLHRPRAI